MSEQDDASSAASDKQDEGKTSTLAQDELFMRLRRWCKEAQKHWSEWQEEAREDYAFVSGHQWSDQEISLLKGQSRPIIVFNRIEPVVSAVSGTEVSNRQEVRYLPRTEGDAHVDEVLSNAADWFRDQCDAEDEESDAFRDTLICGIGCTETRLDFEFDPEGAPLIDRIDPFEIFPDPAAKKRNFEDGRRIFRIRRIPRDEATALVPDLDADEIDASWAYVGDQPNTNETVQEARFYRPTPGDVPTSDKKDLVTVVECQWWERETVYLVASPGMAEPQEIPAGAFKKLMKRAPGLIASSVPMPRRVFKRAYLGKSMAVVEDSPFKEHFSYKLITGHRDRNKGHFYGMVRSMKDPQRWANKWLSQTLHIMNVNAKGGVIAEKGITDNVREFEKKWAQPDAVTWVNDGTISGAPGKRLDQKPGGQFPQGYFNMMEFAIQSVRDASGVNLELLGMKDTEQAGVLEAQRKRQAMAILATMFDSLRRYRKSQGRLLLFIIQTHLSDGRLIRIVGDEGEKYVPLVRQPGVAQYDVKVDEAPTNPQQREVVWALITQMMPMIKDQMTPEMWGAFLPYSPFPASFVEKVKAIISQGAEQRQQQQAKNEQLRVGGATAEIAERQSKANLNNAKAQTEGVHAQADIIQALTPPAPRPPILQ